MEKEIIEKAQKIFPPYSGKIGGRFKDLSGQKFGKLTLLYRGENNPTDTRGRAMYVCLCDCGNIISMRGENIVQRKANISCGHCKEFEFKNKELKYFEKLEEFKEPQDEHYKIKVKCKQCGGVFIYHRDELYRNPDKKCPKCNKGYMIGETIGELTIISKEVDEKNCLKYICSCSCGKIIKLTGTELNSRKTCGTHFDKEDIIGQTFGKLTVVKSTEDFKGHQRLYECKCECGGTTIVSRGNLLSGHTLSCGCLLSKGEEQISKILLDNNIIFEKQKTFTDCYSINSCAKSRFDFYVNNSYIIEFDGEQHFSNCKLSCWGKENEYQTVHQRDLLKNNYCFEHNIPIIRIPYWHRDKITINDLILETSRFILNKENETFYYNNI